MEYQELQVAMKKGNFQDLERHINKHLGGTDPLASLSSRLAQIQALYIVGKGMHCSDNNVVHRASCPVRKMDTHAHFSA